MLGFAEKNARKHGELLVAQAQKLGVLAELDKDGDYVIDTEARTESGKLEAELSAWVTGVLGQATTRHNQLVLVPALLAAGLTRERMVEAVRHPGGFQALCETLRSP